MGWFRWHRRVGAWLALVALALQLGFSFGHVHPLLPDQALEHQAENSQSAPDHPDHDGAGHNEFCAIYAVQSLLAGGQTADAPSLSGPVDFAAATVPQSAVAFTPEHPRTAFRSRAPPLS
jgi:hypothetical protein